MNILVLGATGMLGYSLFSNLSDHKGHKVFGTVRSLDGKRQFFDGHLDKIIENVDVNDLSSVESALTKVDADVLINCVGIIKQHDISKQHISAIEINSLLPHKLARICNKHSTRLIHFSTDCVFDGKNGNYNETDFPSANDLYGRSKCLGEVDYGGHLTLRTSIIGHELNSSVSLIDWFLSQGKEVNGFTKAVFSGLPTCFIAKILIERVLENLSLKGLYHLSVEPIDKFNLISLVSEVYRKEIVIHENTDLVVDRSLNSKSFQDQTGFLPPDWRELIKYMHKDYLKRYV
ncbi:dTDP-4-dehydrorhamnose reductase family protein [Vibrio breoganii]